MATTIYDLENQLIHALCTHLEIADDIIADMSPELFGSGVNAQIYTTAAQYFLDNGIIDLKTIEYTLDTAQAKHFKVIMEKYPSNSGAVESYIQQIKNAWLMRQLFHLANDVLESSVSSDADGQKMLGEVEEYIIKLIDTAEKDDFADLPSSVDHTVAVWFDRRDNKRTNAQYGIEELDDTTLGIHRKALVIIAGRPGSGKSQLGIQVAQYNAIDLGIPTAFFTLEMPREQLIERILACRSQVPLRDFQTGWVCKNIKKVEKSIQELKNAPLVIEDSVSTLRDLVSRIRKLKLKNPKLELVIIDYMQLVSNAMEGKNREQEVATISRTLKNIAMNLNIDVVALSQLNRNPEERKNKRPMLPDLRESGAIEQDADVVIFTYRPFLHTRDIAELNSMELIVAKQRNGGLATVECFNDVNIQKIKGVGVI